jgi:hypothetical protein
MVSTSDTRAEGGPVRHHETSRSTASTSPSNTASTRPSTRLRTHPVTPAAIASRRQSSRKNTPCTLPDTSTLRLTTTVRAGRYTSAVARSSSLANLRVASSRRVGMCSVGTSTGL